MMLESITAVNHQTKVGGAWEGGKNVRSEDNRTCTQGENVRGSASLELLERRPVSLEVRSQLGLCN